MLCRKSSCLAIKLTRNFSGLNNAEILDAESTRDFIHRLKIGSMELRETLLALMLIQQFDLNNKKEIVSNTTAESNDLLSFNLSPLPIDVSHKSLAVRDLP